MKNLLQILAIVTILTVAINAQDNDAKTLCMNEINKKSIDENILKKECKKAGVFFESKNKYSIASGYYLFAQEYSYNIKTIQPLLNKKDTSYIALTYILNEEPEKAKMVYREFLKNHSALSSNKIVKNGYKIMLKIYPEKNSILIEGYKSWSSIYKPLFNLSALYSKYKQARKEKKYKESIKYITEVIKLQKKYQSEALFTNNLYNLGVVYYYNKEYKKATEILHEVEKIYIKNKTQEENLGYIYNWLANSYLNLKDNNQALLYYEKSLKLLGEKSSNTAVIYTNIAKIFFKKKNYKKALENYQISLKIKKENNLKNKWFNLTEIARIYKFYLKNSEKELIFRKKKFELSKGIYAKDDKYRIKSEMEYLDLSCSYNVSKKNIDLNATINSCNKLANFYEIQKNNKKALLPYLYSKNIKKVFELSEADSYEKACAYVINGEIEKANLIYKNNVITKIKYEDLLKYYKYLSKIYPDKKAVLDNSLATMTKIYKSSFPYSQLLHTKYEEKLEKEDYLKALEYISEELKILSKLNNKKYIYYKGLAEKLLGELQYKLNNYDESIKFLEASIETFSTVIGVDNIELAQIYEKLGQLYEEQHLYKQASFNFNKAIKIYFTQGQLENILLLKKNIRSEITLNSLQLGEIDNAGFSVSKPFIQTGHKSIRTLDISKDENYLITAGDSNVILWDIKKSKQLRTFYGQTKWISKIQFVNEYIVSSSLSGTFIIWNIKSGKVVFKIKRAATRVSSDFSVTKNGRFILFMSTDKKLTLFDMLNLETVKDFSSKRYQKFSFINNDTNIVIFDAESLKVVDIKTNKIVKQQKVPLGNPINLILLNDNQIIYQKKYSNKFFIYDIQKNKVIKEVKLDGIVGETLFNYNTKYLVTTNDEYYKAYHFYTVWDLANKKILYRIDKPYRSKSKLSKNGNMFIVVSPKDLAIYIYNISRGKLLKTIKYYPVTEYKSFLADDNYVLNSSSIDQNRSKINKWDLKLARVSRKTLSNKIKYLLKFDGKNKKVLFVNRKNEVVEKSIDIDIGDKTLNDNLNQLPTKYLIKYINRTGEVDLYKNMIIKSNYVENNKYSLSIFDINTGKELKKINLLPNSHNVSSIKFINNGKNILVSSLNTLHRSYHFWLGDEKEFNLIHMYDINNEKSTKVFSGHNDSITKLVLNKSETKLLSASLDGSIKLWNVENSKLLKTFRGHRKNAKIHLLSFVNNENNILSGSSDGTIRLWDIQSAKEIAQFVSFENGGWLCMTEEGYFNASKDVIKYLNITKNTKKGIIALDINQLYDHFFRPDLVKLKLAGEDISKYTNGLAYQDALKNPPPKLSFKSIDNKKVKTSGFSYDDINTKKVKVKLSFNVNEHDNGGVGLIRVYQEGKLIKTIGKGKINKQSANVDTLLEQDKLNTKIKENQKLYIASMSKSVGNDVNMSVEDTIAKVKTSDITNKSGTFTLDVDLKSGKNEISIEAFNKTNTVTSYRENITINAAIPKHKPKLYAIVAGVNNFEHNNAKYRLKYSQNDAKAIKEAAEKQMGTVFDKVEVEYLIGKDVTQEKILQAANKIYKKARLEDTVLFYISTHGRAYKGKLYLVPYNNTSVKDWIDFEKTFKAVQSIKALNQVFVIDACESGKANDIVSSVYDSRASVLAKSSGVHVLLATTKGTYAFESPDKSVKNGVFTYKILQAMKDKSIDTNHDKVISILELSKRLKVPSNNADYQYPVIRNVGSDIQLEKIQN